MLESELSGIDSILENLDPLRTFYAFQRSKLDVVRQMLVEEQAMVLSNSPQLAAGGLFKTETDREIQHASAKLAVLDDRIAVLEGDIASRNQSRGQLVHLLHSLSTTDSLNFGDQPPAASTDATVQAAPQAAPLAPLQDAPGGAPQELPRDELLDLPVMEIREELDEHGEVVSSEVKPFKSNESIEQLLKTMSEQRNKPKTNSEGSVKEEIDEDGNIIKSSFKMNKKSPKKTEEPGFRPFMIREEVDEDGNVVDGSGKISQIPDFEEGNSKEHQTRVSNEDEQLAELFMDMGLKVEEPMQKQIEELDSQEIYSEPLKDTTETHPVTEVCREMYKPEIDPNDVITLELIASELVDQANEGEGNNDDEEWLEVENEITSGQEYTQDDDEDLDDDYEAKIMQNMMGAQGSGLFMQQILEHRRKQAEQVEKAETAKSKVKKSVSFNTTVDVKPIKNIWDDLRKSDYENQLNDMRKKSDAHVSMFKRAAHAEDYIGTDITSNMPMEKEEDEAILDVVERPHEDDDEAILDIVERDIPTEVTHKITPPTLITHQPVNQAVLQDQMDNYQTNFKSFEMHKVGRKPVSKFKMVRAANKGKEFQETYISPETKEMMREMADKMVDKAANIKNAKFKKEFKSLAPPKPSQGHAIDTPKDINPVTKPSVKDEDYEIVRNETNEDLFDDDDEGNHEEFVPSNSYIDQRETDASSGLDKQCETQQETKSTYFPKYEGKTLDVETEVVGASLDYSSLNEDVDSMAKAYVLGLYDDDIATEGQVIEQLDDFEQHNKEVEERMELHERVTELNDKLDGSEIVAEDDNSPMVSTDIVEHDMNEINEMNSQPIGQHDIELSDENLQQELVSDYINLRKKMIYKYRGGFQETEREKEFVLPEEAPRVSRFKAARLGI